MSKINGEKARSAVTLKRRTANREKLRALRAAHIAEHGTGKPKSVVEKLKASAPVVKAKETLKKATDTLAELAESVKPKRSKKSESASE